MSQEVGKGDQGVGVYVPCWNVSKVYRLTSLDEKNEWVENLIPPGARTKFEIYKDVELNSRLDHNIHEVLIFVNILRRLILLY